MSKTCKGAGRQQASKLIRWIAKSKLRVMKIRAKIRLTMLAAFVIGMGLAAAGAYTILKRNAIAESVQNGRILMETASAIRYYTDNHIDPLLKEQLKVQFLPESIHSSRRK